MFFWKWLLGIKRTYADAFGGLPREVWLLAWVMLINRSGSMVLTFSSLYVHTELGYSEELAALVIVAHGVGSSLGTFLGGYLTERFGPIRVQVASLIGCGVGYALLSQMNTYSSFAITLFGVGVIGDIFRPANGVALTNFCPPAMHSKAFGLNRLAINLGLTVGPALGGFLALMNYQWLFWIDAMTCVAAGLMMHYWLGHANFHQEAKHVAQAGDAKLSPWRDTRFLFFLGLTFVTYTVFFQVISTYPLFLKEDYGLNEFWIGMLFAGNTIIVVAVEMVLVYRVRHWRKLPLIAWGSFLMIEGFAMLAFGHGLAYAALSILVWTVGEMLAMPQGLTYASSFGPPSVRPRFLTAYTTAIALSFVAAPLIGAYCYSHNHDLFWRISVPIGFVVLIGTLMVDRLPTSIGRQTSQNG